MTRATTQYVSAYSLAGCQQIRATRLSTRPVVANFNGVLAADETIESATWFCTAPWVTVFGAASLSSDFRSTSVLCSFNIGGGGMIKATVTTSEGRALTATFYAAVFDMPWYGESYLSTGPTSLTVEAP